MAFPNKNVRTGGCYLEWHFTIWCVFAINLFVIPGVDLNCPINRRRLRRIVFRPLKPFRLTGILCIRFPRFNRWCGRTDDSHRHNFIHVFLPLRRGVQVRS